MVADQFMAGFNTLVYLAEVKAADVVGGFSLGKRLPRYYKRAKKNRRTRRWRKCYRRLRMFADDAIIRDACVHLYSMLCPIPNDVSGTTYRMVSTTQVIEYHATLSAFADVPTSEVIESVSSAIL